jgi:hypothetical protein
MIGLCFVPSEPAVVVVPDGIVPWNAILWKANITMNNQPQQSINHREFTRTNGLNRTRTFVPTFNSRQYRKQLQPSETAEAIVKAKYVQNTIPYMLWFAHKGKTNNRLRAHRLGIHHP